MAIISLSIIMGARRLGIVVETVEAREMGTVVKAAGDEFCSRSGRNGFHSSSFLTWKGFSLL